MDKLLSIMIGAYLMSKVNSFFSGLTCRTSLVIVALHFQTISISANDFLKAALRREKAFPQFEMRIDTQEEHRPGSTDTFTQPGTQVKQLSPRPSETVQFSSQTDILVARDKIRFSEVGRMWHAQKLAFLPHNYRITNDGESLRSISLDDANNTKSGYGIIDYAHMASYRRQALLPVLFSLRGGESRLSGIRVDQFKATGRNQMASSQPYQEFSCQDGKMSLIARVDPSEDWNAKRLTFSQDGKVYMTIDITNIKDEQSGLWYPKQWTVQNYRKSDGKLMSVLKSELATANFSVNSSDQDFVLPFPEGLFVSNNVSRTQYRADRQGGLIPITNEGEEYSSSARWQSILIVVGIVVTGFMIVVTLIRYQAHSRTRRSEGVKI